jgi:hypothetical protein
MAFNPQLVHDEGAPSEPAFSNDPAEALELPEDLSQMAGQLVRESALLAQHYPAGELSGSPRSREVQLAENGSAGRSPFADGRRGDAARFLGPALLVLFAISGGAWLMWTGWGAGSPQPAEQLADYSSDASTRRVSYRPAESVAPSGARGRPLPHEYKILPEGGDSLEPNAASPPASMVHELSGPELEGFLDLLDDDDGAAARLSI